MKHKILLGGGTNTGKSLNLITTAVNNPDSKVYIFDPENEIPNLLNDMGLELPNLTVKLVTKDWSRFKKDYNEAKENLGEGDWCCFDMMGVYWDLAQNYFSFSVYGESPAEHIVALRKAAEKADFGGFDGLTDWTVIKRLHNEDIIDDAVRWSPFNVLATTTLTDYAARAKVPQTGVEGLLVDEFGKKLEGEKHNIYRFRTIAILYEKGGKFLYKVIKEKGKKMERPLKEYEFTERNFLEVYGI